MSTFFDEILNGIIENPLVAAVLTWTEKKKVFFVQQGIKSANKELEACTIDKSHAPVYYLELLDGKIQKIDMTDSSNITILYAKSGGSWANRTTTNVYTKGGV